VAEPEIPHVKATTPRMPLDETTWRAHAGDWIAVQGGDIVASGETYYQTLTAMGEAGIPDPEDCDFVAWVPEDHRAKFERWHTRVRAAHLEFRRRLRG